MKRLFLGWLLAASACHAASQNLPLWPEGVPNAKPLAPERSQNGRTYLVSEPALTVFPAAPDRASGTAVIMAPGGGYDHLATVREGEQYAR